MPPTATTEETQVQHKSFAVLETAAHEEAGTFEATVAVFGNVDYEGDRIVAGAFSKSLAKWSASGDPIPVILSHQHHDPMAHIGVVYPRDVKQTSRGLVVKGKLDVEDNEIARQTHKLMLRRSLKEFSFGYIVYPGGQSRGKDGVNNLTDLDLFELGPTLKGANPSTELHAVKSALAAEAPLAQLTPQELRERAAQLEADLEAEQVQQAAQETPEAPPEAPAPEPEPEPVPTASEQDARARAAEQAAAADAVADIDHEVPDQPPEPPAPEPEPQPEPEPEPVPVAAAQDARARAAERAAAADRVAQVDQEVPAQPAEPEPEPPQPEPPTPPDPERLAAQARRAERQAAAEAVAHVDAATPAQVQVPPPPRPTLTPNQAREIVNLPPQPPDPAAQDARAQQLEAQRVAEAAQAAGPPQPEPEPQPQEPVKAPAPDLLRQTADALEAKMLAEGVTQAPEPQVVVQVKREPLAELLPDWELAAANNGELKAVWTTAYINDLPDSAFLYVEPGGSKDSGGKTVPRSNRHFPYRDTNGAVDLPHLRNALSRIPQSNLSQALKDRLAAKAQGLLERQSTRSADVTSKAADVAVAVDPLRKQADAVELEFALDGMDLSSPVQVKAVPERPQLSLSDLRRQCRTEMLTLLSGEEDVT